jgi:hypothetical protein
MELIDDVRHVESHFSLFGDSVVQDRRMVCVERTISLEIVLDIMLTLSQDRCMFCAEHTTSSKIILVARDGSTS